MVTVCAVCGVIVKRCPSHHPWIAIASNIASVRALGLVSYQDFAYYTSWLRTSSSRLYYYDCRYCGAIVHPYLLLDTTGQAIGGPLTSVRWTSRDSPPTLGGGRSM